MERVATCAFALEERLQLNTAMPITASADAAAAITLRR
jgi:hypothetical protein